MVTLKEHMKIARPIVSGIRKLGICSGTYYGSLIRYDDTLKLVIYKTKCFTI